MLECWINSIFLFYPGAILMRTVAGGWFISFTRMACSTFG